MLLLKSSDEIQSALTSSTNLQKTLLTESSNNLQLEKHLSFTGIYHKFLVLSYNSF